MSTETKPHYIRRFWAKARPYRLRGPERIHLLEHHLADVGACFEALLDQPTIRRRLARSGDLDSLDDATAARLALFAALHDIGKVNMGFQTRIWRNEDFPAGRQHQALRWAGHYRELAPVMLGENADTSDQFFGSLDWWEEATQTWDDCGGEAVCGLFIAALSHHGQPMQLEGDLSHNSRLWTGIGDLDPFGQLRRIGQQVRRWFPEAWQSGGQRLPSSPEFQHHFLGLCTLADWIGSNEEWFPFCDEPQDDYMERVARGQARDVVKAIGIDVTAQRERFGGVPGFASLFPVIDGPPNAIQRTVADTPLDEALVIVESETGSGKTEAALWRFARMYEAELVDGMYFALPTRAAATQLHGRVTRFVERLFPGGDRPDPVLAVPGYVRAGNVGGRQLQDYEVWWDDHPGHDVRSRRWAAESSKRYLAAQIAVGTVDQAMMAALKVRHSHMRAACLSRNLLVVDEVHASDPYMRRILKALLDTHLHSGGYALLMSATLGSVARQQWLGTADPQSVQEAVAAHYPAVSVMGKDGESMAPAGENGQEKSVNVAGAPLISEFVQVAEMAIEAARAGARVLVIRNTVSSALATQEALELAASDDHSLLFSVNGITALHHSRFAPDDRRLLDSEVEATLGRSRESGGLVVVGTQTLEQSLDIDADLLITDLCPLDVLLQRMGRLHRHRRSDRPRGYEAPRCTVLTPDSDDLSPLLRGRGNTTGLGPHGFVYEDLRVLEATRRLIGNHPQWDIPRMNRLLVESATHPNAMEAIVEELGEAWKAHALDVEGRAIAEVQGASGNVVRRGKSFFLDNRDVLFPSNAEERIRTRLGDEGVEVVFDPPPVSPFEPGRRIETMTIAAHLLRGANVEGSVTPADADRGFSFAIGDHRFRYDRHGLRREG